MTDPGVFLVVALALLWAMSSGRLQGVILLVLDIFEGKIKSREKDEGAMDKGDGTGNSSGSPGGSSEYE